MPSCNNSRPFARYIASEARSLTILPRFPSPELLAFSQQTSSFLPSVIFTVARDVPKSSWTLILHTNVCCFTYFLLLCSPLFVSIIHSFFIFVSSFFPLSLSFRCPYFFRFFDMAFNRCCFRNYSILWVRKRERRERGRTERYRKEGIIILFASSYRCNLESFT